MEKDIKPNELKLWINDKRTDERHPHFKGRGVDCWASCWVNTDKAGNKWLKLEIEPMDEAQRPKAAQMDDGDPLAGVCDMATPEQAKAGFDKIAATLNDDNDVPF